MKRETGSSSAFLQVKKLHVSPSSKVNCLNQNAPTQKQPALVAHFLFPYPMNKTKNAPLRIMPRIVQVVTRNQNVEPLAAKSGQPPYDSTLRFHNGSRVAWRPLETYRMRQNWTEEDTDSLSCFVSASLGVDGLPPGCSVLYYLPRDNREHLRLLSDRYCLPIYVSSDFVTWSCGTKTAVAAAGGE